jgi:hypothetical protein
MAKFASKQPMISRSRDTVKARSVWESPDSNPDTYHDTCSYITPISKYSLPDSAGRREGELDMAASYRLVTVMEVVGNNFVSFQYDI